MRHGRVMINAWTSWINLNRKSDGPSPQVAIASGASQVALADDGGDLPR
jgi:hypothetical protein